MLHAWKKICFTVFSFPVKQTQDPNAGSSHSSMHPAEHMQHQHTEEMKKQEVITWTIQSIGQLSLSNMAKNTHF